MFSVMSYAPPPTSNLLERLREEEALLHVVVAVGQGVNIADPREARLHSAVPLQRLKKPQAPTSPFFGGGILTFEVGPSWAPVVRF